MRRGRGPPKVRGGRGLAFDGSNMTLTCRERAWQREATRGRAGELPGSPGPTIQPPRESGEKCVIPGSNRGIYPGGRRPWHWGSRDVDSTLGEARYDRRRADAWRLGDLLRPRRNEANFPVAERSQMEDAGSRLDRGSSLGRRPPVFRGMMGLARGSTRPTQRARIEISGQADPTATERSRLARFRRDGTKPIGNRATRSFLATERSQFWGRED